jgi:hypothetical protein
MSDWNKNNLACTTTWTTLMVLDQLKEVFPKSGTLTMKELTFWNATTSEDVRKIQAATIARQMDNIFTKLRGALYEEGSSTEKAVSDIITILTDETKIVSDLAATNDTHYLFLGEEHV